MTLPLLRSGSNKTHGGQIAPKSIGGPSPAFTGSPTVHVVGASPTFSRGGAGNWHTVVVGKVSIHNPGLGQGTVLPSRRLSLPPPRGARREPRTPLTSGTSGNARKCCLADGPSHSAARYRVLECVAGDLHPASLACRLPWAMPFKGSKVASSDVSLAPIIPPPPHLGRWRDWVDRGVPASGCLASR